jgi:Phosphatidylethanolamine-binding protein
VRELPEGRALDATLDTPVKAIQGKNSWPSGRTVGYRGPAPPAGKIHYYLTLIIVRDRTGHIADPGRLHRAAMVMCGGVLASVLLGVIGIVAALVRRVRVFIIPNIGSLCGAEFPTIAEVAGRRPRFNHAIVIVVTSLVLPVMVAATVLLGALFAVNPNNVPLVLAVPGFAVLFGGPFAMIPVYSCCSSRIIARTPGECWAQDVSQASR